MPRRSRLLPRAGAVATVLVVSLSMGVSSAVTETPPAQRPAAALAGKPIVFGASGGHEIDKLAAKVHAPLAPHIFARLKGRVENGRLITLASGYKWRTVAAARPGSPAYRDIVRWAQFLKSRKGRPILFTYSHEPEGEASSRLGTSRQFIAAWQRIHRIFDARGVRNVEYTWNMTSNAFRVPRRDPRSAPKWYPGNRYVDNVATAAYNWYNCGEGRGKWLSLASRTVAPLGFAKAHHKRYVLAEWASQRGARRAAWLRDARQWFLHNKRFIRGAFYYQTPKPRAGCSWRLTNPSDIRAFSRMARDRRTFGG